MEGLLSELDEYAVEAGLQLIDTGEGDVTVLTMGPQDAVAAVELVLTGLAFTDGTMGVVPAMLAERLGLLQVTFASELSVEGSMVRIRRDDEVASETVESSLPAVVSVTDQINEPRYPSFKGFMAAKKKPGDHMGPSRPGRGRSLVGLDAAWSKVLEVGARPPRTAGEVVTDEGQGGAGLAQFLATRKFV